MTDMSTFNQGYDQIILWSQTDDHRDRSNLQLPSNEYGCNMYIIRVVTSLKKLMKKFLVKQSVY